MPWRPPSRYIWELMGPGGSRCEFRSEERSDGGVEHPLLCSSILCRVCGRCRHGADGDGKFPGWTLNHVYVGACQALSTLASRRAHYGLKATQRDDCQRGEATLPRCYDQASATQQSLRRSKSEYCERFWIWISSFCAV
eukprot:symbB.v1.2.021413.t1/scaffold1848.1/size98926/2